MRVLYLGAPVDAPEPDLPFANRFQLLGLNAGNLLIGNSLHRALKTSHYLSRLHVALSFLSPDAVNEQFDVIVIPAANFIGSYTDMSDFADFIEKTKLPCVMVGLGAQAASFETFVPPLRKGTQRFLSIVAERSKSIGVRGNYSAEVMNRLGYKNVVACGCPSLFRSLRPELKIKKKAVKSLRDIRVVLNGSRNVVRHSFAPDNMQLVEVSLINSAIKHKHAFILQNEEPEIGVAVGEFKATNDILYALRAVLDDIGLTDVDERLYFDRIRDHFKFFFDLESWDKFIRKFDFSIGSRFHGNVMALTNGIPAFIFAHDARTKELCELAEIPHRAVSDVTKLDTLHFYTRSNFDAFESRYSKIYQQYAEFLSSNGLQHRLSGVAQEQEARKKSSRLQRIVVDASASATGSAQNKIHLTPALLTKLASESLDQNARDRERLMSAEGRLRELEFAARFAQKVIDERGIRIAELETELRSQAEQSQRVEQRLAATQTHESHMHEAAAFAQGLVERQNAQIAELELALRGGNEENERIRTFLDGTKVELGKLQASLEFAHKVIEERGERIADLEASLHASMEEDARTKIRLRMTESEMETLQTDLAFSQKVAEERDEHIAAIETLLSATSKERAILQTHFEGAVVEIGKLHEAADFAQKVVDERGVRIAELETTLQRNDAVLLARIEEMEAALADYHNSLAWKVSSRLRAMRGGMGKLWLRFRTSLSRKLFRIRFSSIGFALTMAMRALRHRSRIPLRNWRLSRVIANSDLFDRRWYRETYPDIARLKINPVRHYVAYGVRERRDPGPSFSTASYLQRYPDVAALGINPLAHYILYGLKEGRSGQPQASSATEIPRLRCPASQEAVSVPLNETPMEVIPPARLIAFYLPQFHPIPHNDEFWGKGFTEWRNVTRGVPQFVGHYQPRVPGELGYYDLRIPAIQQRQVELAKRYGIGGFCFYFYWFHGERPLELPLEQYLSSPNLDLPFCLCWANENWTRTWDGLQNDVLLAQAHSPEDDLALIAHLARYLCDPRYIRVDGKPLVIVYRPSLLPNAKETAARWRKWCRETGIGEIYLCYVQSFESGDPAQYGFDAATEFPPNNMGPDPYPDALDFYNPDFAGRVYDWDCFVRRSAFYQTPAYKLFRGVCPSWDNEARRPGRGTILLGSTPERYQQWLENAVRDTVARFDEPSERLVFINAWNEWAEGAYLEPDARYGFAYLQATRDAIEAASRNGADAAGEGEAAGRRIVIVGHDAHPHGAQFLALNLFRQLRSGLHLDAECVLLRDGRLAADYAKIGPVHQLHGASADSPQAQALIDDLRARGFDTVICNTTASGLFVPAFKRAGFRVVSLVHELPQVLETYEGTGLKHHARAIAADSDFVVFAGEVIGDGFKAVAPFDESRAIYRAQGLYKQNGYRTRDEIDQARRELRERHGLKSTTKVVLAVAFGDHRKGVDLFVDIVAHLNARAADIAMVWVGECDAAMKAQIESASSGLQNLVFAGFTQETDVYFAGADLYALTSREDPFPSVILEAFEAGLPVLAFSGVGAFEQTLTDSGIGRLIPSFDTEAFAREVEALLGDGKELARIGQASSSLIRREFSFRQYTYDLTAIAGLKPRRVSVIVPNFNYLRHIESRLASINAQTVLPYEIIVLDDASTDGSREWLRDNLARICPDAVLVENERNSGSAFAQWVAGVSLARGDYVWIAEADDLADPGFLAETLSAFDDPDVVLSYCQSKQMDEDGKILCEHYLDYVADVSANKWRDRYVNDGIEEVVTGLSVKNTIPNVSGVVFRREALLATLKKVADEIKQFRVAGDWVIYTEVLREGKIAFSPRSLNLHRRHSDSVTISRFDETQLKEIMRVQKRVREHFEAPDHFAALAEDYAGRLYAQFGLTTREHPTLRDNPDLAQLLTPQLHSMTEN